MNPAEFSPAATYGEREADDAPQDRPSLNVSLIFHGEQNIITVERVNLKHDFCAQLLLTSHYV
jgi:hypothetical protein